MPGSVIRRPSIPPNARWYGELEDLIRHYHVTLDCTSVAANSTSEQTFTITGLNTQDVVFLNKSSHTSGLGVVNARVSAKDTLAITFMNCTALAIDPSSETYTVMVIRGD